MITREVALVAIALVATRVLLGSSCRIFYQGVSWAISKRIIF